MGRGRVLDRVVLAGGPPRAAGDRPGEKITLEEYYRWMFENSVPGLPEKAAQEGLDPLGYMRKYGCVEVSRDDYAEHDAEVNDLDATDVEGPEQTLTKRSFDPEHL